MHMTIFRGPSARGRTLITKNLTLVIIYRQQVLRMLILFAAKILPNFEKLLVFEFRIRNKNVKMLLVNLRLPTGIYTKIELMVK